MSVNRRIKSVNNIHYLPSSCSMNFSFVAVNFATFVYILLHLYYHLVFARVMIVSSATITSEKFTSEVQIRRLSFYQAKTKNHLVCSYFNNYILFQLFGFLQSSNILQWINAGYFKIFIFLNIQKL